MKPKVYGVIEVVLVFAFVHFLVRWALTGTPLWRWQFQNLYWNYFGHTIFIFTALFMIFFPKRDMKTYGLSLTNLRYNLVVGWSIFAVLVGIPILGNWVSGNLVLNPQYEHFIASTLIFQFFFSGFGEELFFRGYLQSRLNETFGRPFHLWGINFGVGLIITSLLFAFAHVLNPFNPFRGVFALDWGWGLRVLPVGLLFGLVREKTGSIVAAGIIHGRDGISNLLLSLNSTTFVAYLIAYPIAWFLLFSLTPLKKNTR